MKFLSVLAFVTSITAVAVSSQGGGAEIPGTAGAQYCDHKNYNLTIEMVDIDPPYVVRGQSVGIIAKGMNAGTISEGSMLEITLKKGLKKKHWKEDLCAMPAMQCGLEGNGTVDLSFGFDVPKDVSAGKWNVKVVVHGTRNLGWKKKQTNNPNEELRPTIEKLACVKGKVKVHKK